MKSSGKLSNPKVDLSVFSLAKAGKMGGGDVVNKFSLSKCYTKGGGDTINKYSLSKSGK